VDSDLEARKPGEFFLGYTRGRSRPFSRCKWCKGAAAAHGPSKAPVIIARLYRRCFLVNSFLLRKTALSSFMLRPRFHGSWIAPQAEKNISTRGVALHSHTHGPDRAGGCCRAPVLGPRARAPPALRIQNFKAASRPWLIGLK
jgi:hypothetical protein